MNTITKLRELLEKAGTYPDLEPVGPGKTYTCPLCDGAGDIDSEHVKEGQVSRGAGLDISIVGVQVYGFGQGMAAMELLIPTIVHHLPALLDVAEASNALDRAIDGIAIHGIYAKNQDCAKQVVKLKASVQNALARLGEA